MPRIAIELDIPASFAEAAKKQGRLSSPALWMAGCVSPDLFGKGRILVSDEEFMEPIEADWYAARGAWGPGLDDDNDRA